MKMKVLLVLPMLLSSAYCWLAECGQSKYADAGRPTQSEFIVGGREARVNEYPYQLSLRRSGSLMCGAVLINNNWALSAAHCTRGEPLNIMDVVAGQHRRSDTGLPSRVVVPLSQVVDHPGYNPTTVENDITLLRLSQAITMNADVQPACRPLTSHYAGDTAVISGWGTTVSGGSTTDELRYATLPVMADNNCVAVFGAEVFPGMMCAGRVGSNPTDSCQGDSGGPLAVKRNGRFDVVGLTSWGYGCADATPGVYARVSHYLGWINGIIN